LRRHRLSQTVEDQVKIGFSGYGDNAAKVLWVVRIEPLLQPAIAAQQHRSFTDEARLGEKAAHARDEQEMPSIHRGSSVEFTYCCIALSAHQKNWVKEAFTNLRKLKPDINAG